MNLDTPHPGHFGQDKDYPATIIIVISWYHTDTRLNNLGPNCTFSEYNAFIWNREAENWPTRHLFVIDKRESE